MHVQHTFRLKLIPKEEFKCMGKYFDTLSAFIFTSVFFISKSNFSVFDKMYPIINSDTDTVVYPQLYED